MMSSPLCGEARIASSPRQSRSPTGLEKEKGKEIEQTVPEEPTGSEAGPAPPPDNHDEENEAPEPSGGSITTNVSNPALEIDSMPDPVLHRHGAHDDDGDSAVGGMDGDSTQSVRSSIYDYVVENGRTFHRYKEGKYFLPNDAAEQDRLDLQHQLGLILLDGKLHLAPIGKNPQWVLDVGTGTGIWAIDFANLYPSAQVIGTDLSPIQPIYVPPNCAFEVDDAEDDWIFTHDFDYIHMRAMMTCFEDPRSIIAKSYEALAPGGWLELQDAIFPLECRDDTLKGTALEQWVDFCIEGGERLGRRWTHVKYYQAWMEELGFEDVRVKVFEVPINTWPKGAKPKALGMWFLADILQVIGATMTILTRGLGWEVLRAEAFIAEVRNDLKNRGIHAYMPVHYIWGRKPKHHIPDNEMS